MTFRKEKKYRLSYSDIEKIKSSLIRNGMKKLYPSRIINSCYFDTDSYEMFHQSEEGVLPRKKIRVRWYNYETKFKKEIKISAVEGRHKKSSIYKNITKSNQLKNIYLFDSDYGALKSKIIINYQRDYYILKKMRITFDKNINYHNVNSIVKNRHRDNECVMEIKVEQNCNDDYIKKYVDISISRFSKYARGILLLNLIK